MKSFSKIGITLFCSLFIFTSAFAKPKPTPVKNVKSQIVKFIQNPDLELGTNEVVNLQFLVNKDNELIVVAIDSESEYLAAFIRTRLDRKSITTQDVKHNEIYKLPIRFRSKA